MTSAVYDCINERRENCALKPHRPLWYYLICMTERFPYFERFFFTWKRMRNGYPNKRMLYSQWFDNTPRTKCRVYYCIQSSTRAGFIRSGIGLCYFNRLYYLLRIILFASLVRSEPMRAMSATLWTSPFYCECEKENKCLRIEILNACSRFLRAYLPFYSVGLCLNYWLPLLLLLF